MNTNPHSKVILCFGDSNTWGQKPDKTGRYPSDVRWTGQLQKLLGDSYYIIEEGLSSRTTDLEYSKPGRNGKTYLQPCLESHNPLDIVLVMLGTNDLKTEYSRSAEAIASALKGLVEDIRQYGKNRQGQTPKIVLMSPILVDDNATRFMEFYKDQYDHSAATTSVQLPGAIKNIAEETNCSFVDASSVAHPGEDGIHFSEDSPPALAELLVKEIKALA